MGAIEKFVIEGDKKGGGGGGGGYSEDPNTLRSLTTVRILEVISEGECEGFPLAPEGRCIYFNDTPVQNEDGSYNFSNVKFDSRVGLPSQPYMAGYPNAEAPFSLSATLTQATPVVQSISSADIDAVRVTIQLPNGLSNQNTSSGGLKGYSVAFAFDVRAAGDVWVEVLSTAISGKTMSPYERDYRLARPAGNGLWDFRVRRLTGDNLGANIRANTVVVRFTEIQDVKEEYNHSAYVGLQIDAQATGGSIPTRSYRWRGIKCQVPVNYDPLTRVYSGMWNGTFKTAWTDNPAWVLYDLIDNERYGLGEYIAASQIDKFSFYNASIYNDELVPDGNDGFEPRYRFNGVINSQEDALKVIQAIAGVMRASVIYSGGVIWVNQDRPADPVKLVTKANIIDGRFSYASTSIANRHTVARVTWYDKDNKYLPTPTTVEDVDGIARYGYYPVDLTAFGTVTEGQAIRVGKWYLDKELNTTEVVTYQSSINQFDLVLGDIIKVYDEDYTNTVGAGRIVAASSTSITLDRAVELDGTSFIDIIGNDGKSINTYQLNESSGLYTTVTPIALHTLAELPNVNADYIVTSAVAPRLFRITDMKFDARTNLVSVTAAFYDPTQYARIEEGITLNTNPYTVITAEPISAPTGFDVLINSYTDDITGPHTSLTFTWVKSPEKLLSGYQVMWRKDGGPWSAQRFVTTEDFTIEDTTAGNYDVSVIAQASTGVSSLAGIHSFLYGYTGVNSLYPPATLAQTTTASLTFNTDSLSVAWTDDARNDSIAASTLNGWLLKIYDNATNTLVRSVPLSKGTLSYTYSHDLNIADGGPYRVLHIDAYSVDVFGNLSSTAKSVIFTNPSPAVLSNVVSIGVIAGTKITYDKPTDPDYQGVLIWGTTVSGFTPSAANLVFEGDATVVSLTGLAQTTTYYYKIAAYDSFSKSYTGSGMNLSGQFSATTLSGAGVPAVTSLPGTAAEGDVVMLKTDGKLYRYHSGEWTAAVPTVDLSGTIGSTQIADDAVTTEKLAAGAVTADQIATNAITADKLVANSITAGQLATSTLITQSSQMDTAVIATAAIQDLAVSNAKIQSITADKISTGTLAATESINVGSTIVIDGEGTITTDGTNTKTVITDGNVVSYKKVGASLYPYQSLNHMETGTANNNATVTIPGYFLNQPTVQVSPANMQFYNPTYAGQAQSIVCAAGAVTQTGTSTSIWQFTPTAQLTLASGNGSTTINAGSGDISSNSWTSSTYTTAANTTTITPTVQLKSVRGNGVSQYYYRSIKWRVEYYNGSSWVTTDAYRTVNMGAQTTTAQTDSKTFTFPSSGTWQWRIYTEEFDTNGTVFGAVSYTYTQETLSPANATASGSTGSGLDTVVSCVSAYGAPALSGEIYQIDYKATLSFTSAVTSGGSASGAFGVLNKAYTGGARNFVYTTGNVSTTGVGPCGTFVAGRVNEILAPYAAFNHSGAQQVVTLSGSNLSVQSNYWVAAIDAYPSGTINVSNLTLAHSAVVYHRTPVANSATPVNNSYITTYGYDLSSAQVLATGTVNWIAIGN